MTILVYLDNNGNKNIGGFANETDAGKALMAMRIRGNCTVGYIANSPNEVQLGEHLLKEFSVGDEGREKEYNEDREENTKFSEVEKLLDNLQDKLDELYDICTKNLE